MANIAFVRALELLKRSPSPRGPSLSLCSESDESPHLPCPSVIPLAKPLVCTSAFSLLRKCGGRYTLASFSVHTAAAPKLAPLRILPLLRKCNGCMFVNPYTKNMRSPMTYPATCTPLAYGIIAIHGKKNQATNLNIVYLNKVFASQGCQTRQNTPSIAGIVSFALL
jgi:hypothetical protein